MTKPPPIDERRAVKHLLDLLAVEGPSGAEGRVVAAVRARAREAGCKAAWIHVDDAPRRIPLEFESGNLIIKLPGTFRAPRRLLMGHMDTVPLCRGARPVRRGRRIVSAGRTGLGADDRTAVACLVTVLETILRRRLDHPPLTFLFSVGEEVGLWGARVVRLADLGRPRMGFNIDGGKPARLTVGAVGAERWVAEVLGRSAHAAVHPDQGVSAALIASMAIDDVAARGWFGRVEKGRKRGTSNVGVIRGGEATNQVTDRVEVRGESRSHDPRFVSRITQAYRQAFERAARRVKNDKGVAGKVRFKTRTDYAPFRLEPTAPVVQAAAAAARSLGLQPELQVIDGGVDANHLNARGVPTVTLGAGQHRPHTLDEFVNLREYVDGCRLALLLATERQ